MVKQILLSGVYLTFLNSINEKHVNNIYENICVIRNLATFSPQYTLLYMYFALFISNVNYALLKWRHSSGRICIFTK